MENEKHRAPKRYSYRLAYFRDGKPSTFGKDRVCASKGCTTRLSQYNPDDFCITCEPKHPDGRTPRQQ